MRATIGAVTVINLNGDLAWDSENDRAGYRHRVAALGRRLGASLVGGSVYELPPGEKTWPYHYEIGCEEWVVVISGYPTLRTPDGQRGLEPGDLAVFPEGPSGAHQISNESSEPCRVLLHLLEVAAGDRPLPGQRQGRPLVAGRRVPVDPAARAQARLLARRRLTPLCQAATGGEEEL